MGPATQNDMDTHHIKEEVDKNLARLRTLRDEVKVQIHLASLDAKKEWDEVLSPKVLELEQSAKTFSEPTRTRVKELVQRLEDYVARLRSPKH